MFEIFTKWTRQMSLALHNKKISDWILTFHISVWQLRGGAADP